MGLPAQIGRYRVVGYLASGGMAEILLGKLVGPSGFERPVVIKRILPHLARQDEFVRMFLDEARLISRIQHPNVVQVHELGRDGEDLFMAMEYLAGESAMGVMRRASSRKQPLDLGLAAYIVAQCCAGLHAAHELKDPDGNPLQVVHRDVSPHNIFVTYEGSVKLIDFGIARFSERASETQAGQLKGKFSYMSPEQCRTSKVDRRSDIFALGTVLFELTTGKRLFARETSLATMKAICEEPLPSPARIIQGYPKSLETICLRALTRDPQGRYQTALEMRRDLRTAMRELPGGDDLPEEALAGLMTSLFGDRVDEKRDLLRRLGSGSEVTSVPAPEVDGSIEIPTVGSAASFQSQASQASQLSQPSQPSRASATPFTAETPTPAPRAGSRWPWIAAGAATAAAAMLALLLVGDSDEPSQTAVASSSAAPVDVEPTENASTGAPAEEEPEVVAPEDGTDPEPQGEVRLRIESDPSRSQVRVQGEERGRTPVDVQWPRGEHAVSVVVWRPGYEPWTGEVVPSRDAEVNATLRPLRRSTSRVRRREPARMDERPPPEEESSPFRRFR